MSKEQNLNSNSQEEIINNESVPEVVHTEVVSEEDKQAKIIEKAQKEKENNEQIAKVREDLMKQFENSESKEEYPEGHIMNPNMLDKIAQLESIDWDTLESSQKKYDDYINGQLSRIIGNNQKKLQANIDLGKKPKYYDADTILGIGGLNRYVVRDNGIIELARGGMVESGDNEYKEKLAQKAKELGIKVEGQE